MVIDYSNSRLPELCMQEFVTTNPVTEIKQFRKKIDKCRFSFKVKNTLSFNSNVEFIRNWKVQSIFDNKLEYTSFGLGCDKYWLK